MSTPVVVVTGASGGVGRATAIEFGRHGARVALLARGAAGLRQALEGVEAAGGSVISIPTDVSDSAQVRGALDRIEQEWGSVDIWVNAAFTSVLSPFDKLSSEEFRRVTEVSYLGYVYGSMAVLPRMQERGQGTIVQVVSALACRGIPLQSSTAARSTPYRVSTSRCAVNRCMQRVRGT